MNIRPTFDRISARPKAAITAVGVAALVASVAYLVWTVDLSAIGDTLTLPITMTVNAWRMYEESRPKPPPPPAEDKPLTPERIHGGII